MEQLHVPNEAVLQRPEFAEQFRPPHQEGLAVSIVVQKPEELRSHPLSHTHDVEVKLKTPLTQPALDRREDALGMHEVSPPVLHLCPPPESTDVRALTYSSVPAVTSVCSPGASALVTPVRVLQSVPEKPGGQVHALEYSRWLRGTDETLLRCRGKKLVTEMSVTFPATALSGRNVVSSSPP